MAINPKIKQKAEDIRKKIFGSEVRESLASGIEAISEDVEATIGRQDYVEEQFQDVLDETTGKDVISAPELIAARNGKSNLKTRLDEEHAQVTAQLQQTVRVINVKSYGAVGDGVTDDTDSLRDAFNSINQGDLTTVVFPKGDYINTIPLNLSDNVEIIGYGARILSTIPVVFKGSFIKNITISNMNLKGPGWTLQGELTTDGLITITDSENVIVSKNTLTDAYVGISIIRTKDIQIEGNNVNKIGVYGVVLSRSNNFIVSKNTIFDIMKKTGDGTYFISATGSQDVVDTLYNKIIDNTLYNNDYWSGIMSHNIRKLIISGNHIFNCRNGIDLTTESAIEDVVISDNIIDGTDTDIWLGAPAMNHGIALIGIGGNGLVKNVVIKGNIISGFGKFKTSQNGANIIVQGVYGAVITGNTLTQVDTTDTYASNVVITGGSKNINVSGNVMNSALGFGVSLTNVTGGNINVSTNIFESGNVIPIRLINSIFSGLIVDKNVGSSTQLYRESGTNSINGLIGTGFGTSNERSLMVTASDVTVLGGETKLLQYVDFPNTGITTLLDVKYSRQTSGIIVYATRADSLRVAVWIKNDNTTTFTGVAGNVVLRATTLV